MTQKKVIERTRFYKDVLRDGIEATPPINYFEDVEATLEDLLKQINELREANTKLTAEVEKLNKSQY